VVLGSAFIRLFKTKPDGMMYFSSALRLQTPSLVFQTVPSFPYILFGPGAMLHLASLLSLYLFALTQVPELAGLEDSFLCL
jgi:hypothetical protein